MAKNVWATNCVKHFYDTRDFALFEIVQLCNVRMPVSSLRSRFSVPSVHAWSTWEGHHFCSFFSASRYALNVHDMNCFFILVFFFFTLRITVPFMFLCWSEMSKGACSRCSHIIPSAFFFFFSILFLFFYSSKYDIPRLRMHPDVNTSSN